MYTYIILYNEINIIGVPIRTHYTYKHIQMLPEKMIIQKIS